MAHHKVWSVTEYIAMNVRKHRKSLPMVWLCQYLDFPAQYLLNLMEYILMLLTLADDL